MSFKSISAVLRRQWFIDKQWAEQHLPLVIAMLDGKPVDLGSKKIDAYYDDGPSRDINGTDEGDDYFVRCAVAHAGTVKVGRYTSFDNAPEGSVAVIPVQGPIMKYGGDCGEPGSVHMTQWIKAANSSNKIKGIVVMLDSPGGMVDGTATLADAIASSVKPVIGFIDDGMCASAAMWIASACDEIYASRKTDDVGSIGVFCTLYDFAGYFEQRGIKVHEIYAPQSSEKNLDFKKALDGDYSMVESHLKVLADSFIKTIKTNRKGKLNTEEIDPFKGACYHADKAQQIGLIDGIKSFDEVIAMFNSNASGSKNSNNSTEKNSNTMFGNKYPKVSALKGASINDDMIEAANTELKSNGIEGAVLISSEDARAAEEAFEQLEKAESTLTSVNKQLSDITAERDNLKKEVEQLGGKAGAERTSVTKEKDEIETSTEKKFEDYPHNKEVLNMVKDIA